MAEQSQEGALAESANLAVIIDLTQPALGVKIDGVSSPLQSLLAKLPAGIEGILAWVPDFNLTEAAVQFGLRSGAFGSFVEVADVDGNEVAWAFLFLQPQAGSLDAAVGVFLSRSISLGGTPLFGPLLTGVSLSSLGMTYATRPFTVAEIVLPAGAPTLVGDVPQDFGLDVTLTACGSQVKLQLPDSAGSGGGAAAPATTSSAIVASGSDQAPPVHWFPVDQSFGPLTVARIGLLADSGTLGLALDASLDLDVVSVSLQGFLVSFDPAAANAAPPSVSLDGLAVDVSTGPLAIAGSLARTVGPAA